MLCIARALSLELKSKSGNRHLWKPHAAIARRLGTRGAVPQCSALALDMVRASVGTNGSRLPFMAHMAPTAVYSNVGRLTWRVDWLGYRQTQSDGFRQESHIWSFDWGRSCCW
jgi:hypothetical protein